ncbi:MAG: 30S ribosomal protein S3, partial [Planctomycetota bacterium]
MGQKVNPIAFRTGVTRGWSSRWYASKQDFAELLVEDRKLREFITNHPKKTQYKSAGIDRIEIERTRDEVRVMLYVARPGLIIGKKGQEIEILQAELQNLIGRRINLKVEEVGRPELQAQLVAEDIESDRVDPRFHQHRGGKRRAAEHAVAGRRSQERVRDAAAGIRT